MALFEYPHHGTGFRQVTAALMVAAAVLPKYRLHQRERAHANDTCLPDTFPLYLPASGHSYVCATPPQMPLPDIQNARLPVGPSRTTEVISFPAATVR